MPDVNDAEGLHTVETTAARLRALGLDHPVHDPEAARVDLIDRIKHSATLDALLSGTDEIDPTAFDPGWPADAAADSD